MDFEQKAIERLKMASQMSLRYYEQPLMITTSGGKDSDICLELARRSGIAYEVQNSHTTADAPQTFFHIQKQFRKLELQGIKCTISKPMYQGKRTSMWDLIVKKQIPPTRVFRYCCDVLKEAHGRNRAIVTGVRRDESAQRSSRGIYETITPKKANKIVLNNDNDDNRKIIEHCQLQGKTVCNPIIDWTFRDVWDFIQSEKLEINPLYQMGFDRVGCIGCPMAGKRRSYEFSVFPKYKQMYIHAFERMVAARKANGKPFRCWNSGYDVFLWWMGESPDQILMDFEQDSFVAKSSLLC